MQAPIGMTGIGRVFLFELMRSMFMTRFKNIIPQPREENKPNSKFFRS
jgi:hypothetical protein